MEIEYNFDLRDEVIRCFKRMGYHAKPGIFRDIYAGDYPCIDILLSSGVRQLTLSLIQPLIEDGWSVEKLCNHYARVWEVSGWNR